MLSKRDKSKILLQRKLRLEKEINNLKLLNSCIEEHGSSPAIVEFLNRSGITNIKDLNISTEFLGTFISDIIKKLNPSARENASAPPSNSYINKLSIFDDNSLKKRLDKTTDRNSYIDYYKSSLDEVRITIKESVDEELKNFVNIINGYVLDYDDDNDFVTKAELEAACLLTKESYYHKFIDIVKDFTGSIDKSQINSLSDAFPHVSDTLNASLIELSEKIKIPHGSIVNKIAHIDKNAHIRYEDIDLYKGDEKMNQVRKDFSSRVNHVSILEHLNNNIKDICSFNRIFNKEIYNFAREEYEDNNKRPNKDILNYALSFQVNFFLSPIAGTINNTFNRYLIMYEEFAYALEDEMFHST